ncbi:MAG: archaeosortase/exosortase family protein [Opitutaceae bacterium]
MDAGRWLAVFLIACTVLAFWPVTKWLVGEVAASQQIRQSFVLLGAAVGLVAWQHAGQWHLHLETGNRALALLFLAYACVTAAWWLHFSLLVLPAFALALAGCLHVLVGTEAWRFIRPIFIGFVACLIIILLFPQLDWPLRQMAGINAARVLNGWGFTPQLHISLHPAPKLILDTGRNFFEVATECNGFGLITSSAVLAVLASGIAGRRWPVLLWLVPSALALGFFFNLLRILIICVLAPFFPHHYHALHETAGVLILWTGLGLVGWLAWRPACDTPLPTSALTK